MKINPNVELILDKTLSGENVSKEEAITLMRVTPDSNEMYALCFVANKLTRDQFNNKGEVHAQLGIDYAPCPNECRFCVFGYAVTKTVKFSLEEIVTKAKTFQEEGANAIYLMTTGAYDFEEFVKIGREVKANVSTDMPLVANIDDFGEEKAQVLVDAGFSAVYHVVRLREGIDTKIDPKKRIQTIKSAQSVGLDVLFCLEPIGPEHTSEEMVELMFLGKELGVTFHGAMRRVSAPGTPLHHYGEISWWELAKAVAVCRLVMGNSVYAHCTHEPNIPSLLTGGNLIWAETGPNPRDLEVDTSKSRGLSVEECRRMLWEAGFTPLNGPSPSARGSSKYTTRN